MTSPMTSRMLCAVLVLFAVGCGSEKGARGVAVDGDSGRAVADAPVADEPAAEPGVMGMTDEATHAIFGCLEGDSAVYAGPSPDRVAGAVPEVRISLWHAGDGIDGSTVTVAGEAGESVPLAGVRLVGHDSISLAISHYAAAADTSAFVGRVACDSLWGGQRSHRQEQPRRVTYLRVR